MQSDFMEDKMTTDCERIGIAKGRIYMIMIMTLMN